MHVYIFFYFLSWIALSALYYVCLLYKEETEHFEISVIQIIRFRFTKNPPNQMKIHLMM